MKCRDGKPKALLLCLSFFVGRRGKERNNEVRVPLHPRAEFLGMLGGREIYSVTYG